MAPRAPADSIPSMPERVGRYELLLPIASGGMATVYLARSKGVGGFEREVALKLTHAHLRENPDFALDLVEEAKLAGRIRHPNVVSVLDVGDDPLGVFLVMEYIEGDSLSGLLRRAAATGSRLSQRIGLRVLHDALAGLHAAHELVDESGAPLNLVHRDFSPQNVLVGIDGISRLTDFGVAKAATRLTQTATGLIKGKIGYMSPEQARGQKLDRRSDVWAAGVIAWEIVTGRRLFKSDNDVATLLRLVSETPPSARSLSPEVSAALDEVIGLALTPGLQKRCATARELAELLSQACAESGGLADPAEVAECVNMLAGPKLSERHSRVAEVRSLRVRMGRLAVATDPSIKTPDSSVLGQSLAQGTEAEEAETEDSEVLLPTERIEARTTAEATRNEEPPTDTTSVGGVGSIEAPRKSNRTRIAVGVAAALALASAGAFVVSRFARDPVAAAAATAPAPAPCASAAATREPEVASAPPIAAGPNTAMLVVRADAPIARVAVDSRSVAIVPPRNEVRVDLTAHEPGSPVALDLISSDGRRVSDRVTPDGNPLEVSFPKRRPVKNLTRRPAKPAIPASPYKKL
jgi:eukaryotic-like serine/threonine-protein kinase